MSGRGHRMPFFAAVAWLASAVLAVSTWAGAGVADSEGSGRKEQPSADGSVLIRFDVQGGLLSPEATRLPLWSLYRDGLVVWTGEGDPTPGFTARVWTGHLAEDQIQALLRFVEQAGFWKLEADYRPPHEISPDGRVVTLGPAAVPDQPWSSLTVRSAANEKRVTVYPADWRGAPEAYDRIRDRLLASHPEEVEEFRPESFRLEVRRLPSMRGRAGAAVWPFGELDVARAPTSGLRLSRAEGVAVSDFLRSRGSVVLRDDRAFALRLFAEPPR